jgi:hypothetical protein
MTRDSSADADSPVSASRYPTPDGRPSGLYAVNVQTRDGDEIMYGLATLCAGLVGGVRRSSWRIRPDAAVVDADTPEASRSDASSTQGCAVPDTGAARQNQPMTDEQLQAWWEDLTDEQRVRAVTIASQPAPRGMAIDDLSASMIRAGLPTSRMVWTGQPEHLVEMLDDVADFVTRAGATS